MKAMPQNTRDVLAVKGRPMSHKVDGHNAIADQCIVCFKSITQQKLFFIHFQKIHRKLKWRQTSLSNAQKPPLQKDSSLLKSLIFRVFSDKLLSSLPELTQREL